jgi:hypothetical protein
MPWFALNPLRLYVPSPPSPPFCAVRWKAGSSFFETSQMEMTMIFGSSLAAWLNSWLPSPSQSHTSSLSSRFRGRPAEWRHRERGMRKQGSDGQPGIAYYVARSIARDCQLKAFNSNFPTSQKPRRVVARERAMRRRRNDGQLGIAHNDARDDAAGWADSRYSPLPSRSTSSPAEWRYREV